MDYLQYLTIRELLKQLMVSFKPYYKWITFNIDIAFAVGVKAVVVLNLIINGLPSIL